MRTTALDTIRKDGYASPELRAIVYAEATPDELLKQSRDPVVGPLAYKALLRAKRHTEATDWLVGQFDRLSPETAVDVLAAWLANPPPPRRRLLRPANARARAGLQPDCPAGASDPSPAPQSRVPATPHPADSDSVATWARAPRLARRPGLACCSVAAPAVLTSTLS